MDRPGSLWTALGALCLLAALSLPFIANDLNSRLGKLRDEGVVDLATVTSKRFVDRERTDYRGLPRPGFSDYFLTLSLDTKSHTPHAEYLRTGELRPRSGTLKITHELEVPSPLWDRTQQGETIAITFLPGRLVFDKDSLQLTSFTEEQGSTGYQMMLWALATLALVLAAFCLWRGWKAPRTA